MNYAQRVRILKMTNVHPKFTPVWRWLALVYVALGVSGYFGDRHYGTWFATYYPPALAMIVALTAAAFTWQGRNSWLRGVASVSMPMFGAISYLIDFIILSFGAPPPVAFESLALSVLWVAVVFTIVTLTRLDSPRGEDWKP